MQNAFLFIVRTLFDLYLLTFALRLVLQWARVDGRNPLVQFIIKVTNPVVLPLRRILPKLRRIDTASLAALLVLQVVATAVLVRIGCVGEAGVLQVLLLAVLGIVNLLLRICFWAILIYVLLSWVSTGGYNPGAALAAAIVEPLLAPIRRIVPLIGGFDLSPVFAAIAIQAVIMLLPTDRMLSGLLCTALARPGF